MRLKTKLTMVKWMMLVVIVAIPTALAYFIGGSMWGFGIGIVTGVTVMGLYG